ncbi:hypothetical protein Y032_0007g3546 [Ancylostoma ceylanicum]|uniref:Uncharacterized protein n=1 Tax=Ancylostoma ceylanicum TaxID=53326 RepID=A0A016VPR4_9BILA|nr:hypothetical protein Y032_0007g3546 [Ancylostoma ceylanicum]
MLNSELPPIAPELLHAPNSISLAPLGRTQINKQVWTIDSLRYLIHVLKCPSKIYPVVSTASSCSHYSQEEEEI